MRKQLPLFILVAIVGIIGFLVYQVNEMRKIRGEFSGIRNEYLYDTLSNEYADIFDSTIISKSGNFLTHGSKRTNPISTFTYDNKFDILIYKLNITTTNSAFLRNIKEEKTSTGPANKTWYRTCDLAYLEIQYREVFSKDLQEIIVCFEKDTNVKYLKKQIQLSTIIYRVVNFPFGLAKTVL